MNNALEANLLMELQGLANVNDGGSKKGLTEGGFGIPRSLGLKAGTRNLKDLTDKGKSVGVNTGRGETKENVTGLDIFFPIDKLLLLDGTNGKTSKVVFSMLVETGHLGGLPTEENAVGLIAAVDNSLDDLLGGVDVKFAGGIVIKEEHRLGSESDNIIDAHSDEVNTNGVMLLKVNGELKLGADAIRTSNEIRVTERNNTTETTNSRVKLLNPLH
mmetsp:Transcript_33758/g.60946  ORF Transcript_33758/g.60946 Transcript_33758/m.60946 type:complete len:216 (-) Transcript_33758:281-928(-)